MDRILSNYIEKIPYGNETILFNKINGNIVLLENNRILKEAEDIYVLKGSDDDMTTLEKYDFFVDDKTVQEYVEKELSNSRQKKDTTIVISVTEKCNLSCRYCYQEGWDKSDKIGDAEYVSMIVEYIQKIIPKIARMRGKLHICFIGGEPLLRQDIIRLLVKKITVLVGCKHKDDVTVRFHIDTNALLLTRNFLLTFPNLSVSTTLSLEDDHNSLRSNSFVSLVNVLTELRDLFGYGKYELNIRYNVHHDNVRQIERFVQMIEQTGIKCTLDFQNVMNTGSACFVNQLSNQDFEEIYINEIIPILLSKSMDAQILPEYGLSRHCLGENKYSCKFYTNGQIVLCDAFPKENRNKPIKRIIMLPDMCVKCYDFPYCGGPKPCDTVECTGIYVGKEAARQRIISYVNSVMKNEKLNG